MKRKWHKAVPCASERSSEDSFARPARPGTGDHSVVKHFSQSLWNQMVTERLVTTVWSPGVPSFARMHKAEPYATR
jgi:hypothetical protein